MILLSGIDKRYEEICHKNQKVRRYILCHISDVMWKLSVCFNFHRIKDTDRQIRVSKVVFRYNGLVLNVVFLPVSLFQRERYCN